tara:strand:- start:285 stop:920 length:636 start_codon:yes stop_codon:yes gene_type:complete
MTNKLDKHFKDIQSSIYKNFKELETSKKVNISKDSWNRAEGGGGKTMVIADGSFFDNCAINYSSIYGTDLPKAALANSLNKDTKFGYKAMGVSVISHPKNPHVPTSHMNVRFFGILDKNREIKDWWIGGGYDLTPFIPYQDDILTWHKSAKKNLDGWDASFYKIFSDNCNNYFNIPHRKERRGVGGIFLIIYLNSILKIVLISLNQLPYVI